MRRRDPGYRVLKLVEKKEMKMLRKMLEKGLQKEQRCRSLWQDDPPNASRLSSIREGHNEVMKQKCSGRRGISVVPAIRPNISLFVLAMRYQRLCDVKSLNKHLPSGVVETEDSLVFLDVVFSLLRDATGCCRDCFHVSARTPWRYGYPYQVVEGHLHL